MKFTLKQLKYFEAVLRSGSIARAADEMNISQSSITAAIDIIEGAIGIELVRRLPAKGVIATDNGKLIFNRIQKYLDQTRIFETDLMSLFGNPEGTLKLGCYAPPAHYVLPPVLKHLSLVFPSLKIGLTEGDSQSLQESLNSGKIDAMMTFRRFVSPTQPFSVLFSARPVALIPNEWPLASSDKVTIEELAELPMILLDLQGGRTYFEGIFNEYGLKPKIAFTSKSSPVLRGLVAAKFGFALLNICDDNDRSGRLGYVVKPISGTVDTPNFGIATTPASKRSPIIQAVIESCEKLRDNGAFNHLLDPTQI